MIILERLSFLSRLALVLFLFLCLVSPGYAATDREVTLQWDHSIDYPYIDYYRVYYSRSPGGHASPLTEEDRASYYRRQGAASAVEIDNEGGNIFIQIPKDETQITLIFEPDNSKDYYFVVTAVDTRGLEGVPTPELSIRNLKIVREGGGAGRVTIAGPTSQYCIMDCSKEYTAGTALTLTAAPDPGYQFIKWDGACSAADTAVTCNLTMDTAKNVRAKFLPRLNVEKTGIGSGTVTGSPPGVGSNINCGTSCSSPFEITDAVTLTPSPAAGNVFTGWDVACTGTGPCIVTMNEAKTVQAEFRPLRRLTVTKAGTGRGKVTSSPGVNSEINCDTGCASANADYAHGASVTLTADPNDGYAFAGWSGGCVGAGLTCMVTMDAAKSVTATFAQARTLTIQQTSGGGGTITGSASGISCGTTDCTFAVPVNTTVTLTAAPDPGYAFIEWLGDFTSATGPTCVVTMSAPKTVTARFLPLLTVVRDGTGTGTVTGSPAGVGASINCGTSCSAPFNVAPSVTLTAAPAPGSDFVAWGGACSGTGLQCTLTMSVPRSVTATFTSLRRLSVVKAGTGRGSVTASPDGIGSVIDCGTGCSSDWADYESDAAVTLTAAPDALSAPGNLFMGWSGGCVGTALTCVVTMNAVKSVTAAFLPIMAGDINLNGAVNLADAILIFQALSRTLPAGIHIIADADSDGKLGLADAIYILQKAAVLR